MIGRSAVLATAFWMCLLPSAFAAPAERVVVIGCDGMSPDGIAHAKTPHMDRMMAEGASTMHARAVMPTSSSPNWASMIMGAGPEQHGVTSNDWRADKYETAPTVKLKSGFFPTVFAQIHLQLPEATTASIYDWGGFGNLFSHDDVDIVDDTEGPEKTTARVEAVLRAEKPLFTFVHLDHVDHVGHDKGHGTPEYYASVEEADAYIGRILAAIDAAGIAETTAVIVTSDHGGKGKGHGGNSMGEIEIPWIIVGPTVARGHEIAAPVNTFDTAATVAYLLGVEPHAAWIARPVLDAFSE